MNEELYQLPKGVWSQIKSVVIAKILVLMILNAYEFCPFIGVLTFEGTVVFETLLTFKSIAEFFAHGPLLYLGETMVLLYFGQTDLFMGMSLIYASYLALGYYFGRGFCMKLPFVKAAYDKNKKSIILGLIMLAAMICIFKVEDRSKTSGKL